MRRVGILVQVWKSERKCRTEQCKIQAIGLLSVKKRDDVYFWVSLVNNKIPFQFGCTSTFFWMNGTLWILFFSFFIGTCFFVAIFSFCFFVNVTFSWIVDRLFDFDFKFLLIFLLLFFVWCCFWRNIGFGLWTQFTEYGNGNDGGKSESHWNEHCPPRKRIGNCKNTNWIW